MLIDNFCNTDFECFKSPNGNPEIRFAPFSAALQSDLTGPVELDKYSCINRSTVNSYVGVGLHSYISDSIIGKYSLIGSRVSIGGFEHPKNWLSIGAFQWGQSIENWNLEEELSVHFKKFKKPDPLITKIMEDCWIGNNAVVKAGVVISPGAIIGSGSIVTKNVPPYAIAVGNPARIIGYRFSKKIIKRLLKVEWWNFDLQVLIGVNFEDINAALDYFESLSA